MSCNTFDSIGSKFSPRVLSPDQARARLMTVEQRIGYQSNAISRRNSKLITQATSGILSNIVKGTYPAIDDAVTSNIINPSKIADFAEWAGYTDKDINSISKLLPDADQLITLYQLLEYYLDENFARTAATGNTCATIVNALAQVIGFLSAGAKLISDLRNFSLDTIIARLNVWKEMLHAMVDELVKSILEQIQNFANQIMAYAFRVKEALSRFMKKIDSARKFLSELTVQSVKDKIEEIIAKVAGQFEDLTPESITHLLMVICQLADSITSFMQSPLDGVRTMFNNYLTQEAAIRAFSDDQVSRAVDAGNPRIDQRDAAAVVEVAASDSTGQSRAGTIAHLRNPNMTEEERSVIAQILATGEAQSSGIIINHSPKTIEREANGSGGWSYVINNGEDMLYVVLFRIAKAMEENITVTCAYRSPEANAELRRAGRNPARSSLHMRGLALDVGMGGFTTSQKAMFIDLASSEGMGGIQYYPSDNFTHIDVGTVRWWPNDRGVGGESTIPSEIRDAQYRHLNGQPAASIPRAVLRSNAQ